MLKTVNRNFLKKIAKIQFFVENQCRTLLYFSISRIFDKISFLKLWTIKKIIKKWTKKLKDAHKVLNFYPKILIVWLLERLHKILIKNIYILGYMEKSIFWKFGVYFRWKMWKTVNRNFLKKNRKNLIFCGKSMSYNVE